MMNLAAIGLHSRRADGKGGMLSKRIRLGNYRNELSDVCAQLIVTSPPYNIGSRGPRKDGFRRSGKYDPKSYGGIRDYHDELDEGIYQQTQMGFLLWCADHLRPDGVVVYNHKPRKREKALIHPLRWILRPEVAEHLVLVEEIIWDRGSTHNHDTTQLWAQTEMLYVLRRVGGAYHFDVRNLPKEFRSNVWRIPPAKPNGHACRFPDLLAELVVKGWSKPGDLVCDPYLGSGTSAVAAVKLGRRFVGSEIEPNYHSQALAVVQALYDEPLECAA